VLADHTGAGPAQLEQFLHNPKEANVALGGGSRDAGSDTRALPYAEINEFTPTR
jgi:hypothetical protein